MKRTARLVLGLAFLAAMASGCGYALAGRGNSLPASIRIIGIPDFVNQSQTPELDRLLTDAVRQEFQGRGRYRIVADTSGVDALLTVTLQPIISTPIEFNSARQGSKYAMMLLASVQFTDERDKKVFYANPALRALDEYILPNPTAGADPVALFGADRNALERVARTFARTLVTSILEAF